MDTTGLPPGVWNIDAAHSEVSFTARHLMVANVRGTFRSFSGQIVVASDLPRSSVSAVIDAASLDTHHDDRDEHLRSAGFFDVANYPTITFVSTGIRLTGDMTAVVTGDLTVRDKTNPVELSVEFHGVAVDPWGGGLRAGFSAGTTVRRKDFGIDVDVPIAGGGLLVGETVKIGLEIEAVLPPR